MKIKYKQLIQFEKKMQQREQENLKNQIKYFNNIKKQLEKEINSKSKPLELKELNEKKKNRN